MGYLDGAASAPVRPEALAELTRVLTELPGNPSGAHRAARAARRELDDARDVLAEALGCGPGDVVFTAGGTEADNLAVLGVLDARGGVVVSSAVEHPAVRDPAAQRGGRVVPVDGGGRVDLDALAAVLDDEVTLVSVMLVNNEVGTIQPLDEVVEVVRRHAPVAVVHTDAVQALPWVDVAGATAGADLISVSAHKFGGPKGVGALVVRPGVALAPRLVGGGQERARRSGTQNVAGIAAMAAAARVTVAERPVALPRTTALRDRLADGLLAAVPDTVETGIVDGDRSGRAGGLCHLCVAGVEAEALLFLLDEAGISASAASSCASGAAEPSHVLSAMGVPVEWATGSLRLSLSWASTDADVDLALTAVPAAVARLRQAGRP